MEVYLNVAETGIGTYGANAGSMRYFGHDASAMSATEAARIAAVLPLPKKRGAVAPKGFTRRYGNTHRRARSAWSAATASTPASTRERLPCAKGAAQGQKADGRSGRRI